MNFTEREKKLLKELNKKNGKIKDSDGKILIKIIDKITSNFIFRTIVMLIFLVANVFFWIYMLKYDFIEYSNFIWCIIATPVIFYFIYLIINWKKNQ